MKARLMPGANKPVIMNITGTFSNPKASLDIAGSIASIFDKEIGALINKNGNAAKEKVEDEDLREKVHLQMTAFARKKRGTRSLKTAP